MTLVHMDVGRPDVAGLVPSGGRVEWRPTKRRVEDTTVVMPAPFPVTLVGGLADVEVAPSSSDWCWRVTEYVTGGITRYVAVPDVPEIAYTDLIDVDPATLEPSAEPVAAWWAVAEGMAVSGAEAVEAAGVATAAAGQAAGVAAALPAQASSAVGAQVLEQIDPKVTAAQSAQTAAEAARDTTVAALPSKQDKSSLDADVAAKASTPGTALATALSATIGDQVFPLAPGVPAPTNPASIPVLRTVGDGKVSNWEYIHNGGGGYLWHLMQGAQSTAGDWLVGVGIDSGFGNGFIFRNKSKGIGVKIEQLNTISSATAYGLNVEQKSSVAPAVSMSQRETGSAPLVEYFSFLNAANDPDGTAVMTRWGAYGKPAGEIMSTSGRLVWKQNIEIVGEALDVRDYNTVAANERYRTKVRPRDITFHSLQTPGNFYGMRIAVSGSQYRMQVAPVTTNPDTATYINLIGLRYSSGGGELGFFGVTPVARPAAINAPMGGTSIDAEARMAINAIRTALTTLGLTA